MDPPAADGAEVDGVTEVDGTATTSDEKTNPTPVESSTTDHHEEAMMGLSLFFFSKWINGKGRVCLDICRVCRMEGTPDRQLYYPCLCTGSIKYIHQEW